MDILTSPVVLWVLAGVALLVGYQKFAHRLKVPLPNLTVEDALNKLGGPRLADAKLQRQVAQAKKGGNFLQAGQLLENAGKQEEAVEAYLDGDERFAAAAVLEKLGKLERSAELYLEAGDYKKAAAVFAQANRPARAAELFKEKGNNLEAARFYGLAGEWPKAAALYNKSGYPLRAAEAFEKSGEIIAAAEAYEKHFMENVTYSTSYSTSAASPDQKSALHAGRLFDKAGEAKRALEVYTKGGYFKEAAAVCLKIGQHAKAAELYMRAEDPSSAADAFEKAGDPVQAANLRGEVAFKANRTAEAAAFFQQGKDYLRSAELYESAGMLAEAAGAYEAGDSFPAAGSVYIRAGLKDRAAAAYERGGELETAAKLYEEVGNVRKAIDLYGRAGFTFKSGEAAARAGDYDGAIALLQRVPANDENYGPATEILSEVFLKKGMPALATARLQKVLAGQQISAANLNLYYWLAAAEESAGRQAEALAIYKKVQAEDLRFRDVEQRVAAIQSGTTLPPPDTFHAPRPAAPGSAPAAPPSPGPAPGAAARAAASGPAAPGKGSRFAPREEVGRGPKGTVFRGVDGNDDHPVALRFLADDILQGTGTAQQLVADLKAASQIVHPNLVKVVGFVEIGGQRCVVSEWIQGRNFAEPLKAGKRMPANQVITVAKVMAEVLALVHGRGVVHGGIQPCNLMAAGSVIKIADLGLGRVFYGVSGASHYRAPDRRFDAAGDIYGLGATLYHLLTGTNPAGHAVRAANDLVPGVPAALDALLLRCLSAAPEQRPAAAVLVTELSALGRAG